MVQEAEKPKTTSSTTSHAEGGDSLPPKRLRDKLLSKNVLIALGILGVLVLGAGAFYLFSPTTVDEDVVFSIDERDYTEEDIAPYTVSAIENFDLDRDEAIDAIVDYMKLRIVAEEYGLDITEEEKREALAQTQYAEIVEFEEELRPWLELVGYRVAMNNHIERLANGGKEGYAYVFYYGSLKIEPPFDETPDNFGDETLIERDQEYAREQADMYRAALVDGEMTPEEVLTEASTDAALNPYYFPDGSHSVHFVDEDERSWQEQVFLWPLIDFIEDYDTAGEPSDIQTGHELTTEAITPEEATSEDLIDTYYYFVYLTDITDVNNIQRALDEMEVVIR